MAESPEELARRLSRAVEPGFRERLLDRGLARGLIWRSGVVPESAPPFSNTLTDDLLDYSHTVMAMALRLRHQQPDAEILERAFLVAGEGIEAAVHHGAGGGNAGFHRVTAATAFHLARYSARAYSMLPRASAEDASRAVGSLSPAESALVALIRRSLEEMRTTAVSWLLSDEHLDEAVAERLAADDDFDESDAADILLTTSFMRGIALFDHALTTGTGQSASAAYSQLIRTAEAAGELHAVNHWWTATLASHLIDELWSLSLWNRIPLAPQGDDPSDLWVRHRRDYIQRLRLAKHSAIELWPSQLAAAVRTVTLNDDLVVALPTSAGKTRVAELCILRALAAGTRTIYVTPLRALSAQVERDLGDVFNPLGYSVSALYGAAGVEGGDALTLREGAIVVSTPEKLDFALRNDPTTIDDVGLVVFDEGHMLGPNEREVRYEALVQRILRRDDAGSRRIVCLSALFPDPEEMLDLVAWIRRDVPGEPVHSKWRPTRQRFGILRWVSGAARLDVQVGEESPYVERFIEARNPPKGTRRRNPFPSDKHELTLAAAWRFVEQDKAVLIYCVLRRSVETLGRLLLKCLGQGLLPPLRQPSRTTEEAIALGSEWLGAQHPAVECLRYGVALHHGGLPRPFLNKVEELLRSGGCPVTIASPTLAQGLNLSASVLLVPSIWRNQEVIAPAEFANVTGRAGRAFVDMEGLVLHVVWEDTPRKARWTVQNWDRLVAAARAPRVQSGLLVLAETIFSRIATLTGLPLAEVMDYLTGNEAAWDYNDVLGTPLSRSDWDRDLASLDAAILALLDAEEDESELETAVDTMLAGSLFVRELARRQDAIKNLLRQFVIARAARIWSATSARQRRGYHAAGIGLNAGQFLDAHLDRLLDLQLTAEAAIIAGDAARATESVVRFAQLVFEVAPFRASGDLPLNWPDALASWLLGQPVADVLRACGEEGVEFVQDTFAYRLPWAMEAVRVHGAAMGRTVSIALRGLAALAVEAGSTNLAVINLLRAGLASREAAIAVTAALSASFADRDGMREWLQSEEVRRMSAQDGWPTPRSRPAWLDFYRGDLRGRQRRWLREVQTATVEWLGRQPPGGTPVVVVPSANGDGALVLLPSCIRLGTVIEPLLRSQRTIVRSVVATAGDGVEIEFFGPPSRRRS